MNRTWQLRDELYRVFHNWKMLLVFFALGCGLGWGASVVWPAYHKATRVVFVALNPYRAYSDARFLALAKPRYSNIDNYHYWQMYQLETAIYRDPLIQTTLEHLRALDPYWGNVDATQLRQMLDAEWRTAGRWRLIARYSDRDHAIQAVQVWSEQSALQVKEAVSSARKAFMIDQQLLVAAQELQDARLREQSLMQAQQALRDWRTKAASLPQDHPLPPELRWRVYALTTAYAQENPAWQALLERQPAFDAPAQDYIQWVELALGQYQAELEILPGQISWLETQYEQLKQQYQTEAENSLGLSPNLEVEELGELQEQLVRPASTLALVGGLIGLLVWLFIEALRVRSKERSGE